LEGDVLTSMEERGVVIRFQDSVLFPKSKADLYPESKVILAGLAELMGKLVIPLELKVILMICRLIPYAFLLTGNCLPTRATTVLRFLIAEGSTRRTIYLLWDMANFVLLMPNHSEAARKKNRRVDIVLLRESLILGEP
jgi:chemotaxis protein MotB